MTPLPLSVGWTWWSCLRAREEEKGDHPGETGPVLPGPADEGWRQQAQGGVSAAPHSVLLPQTAPPCCWEVSPHMHSVLCGVPGPAPQLPQGPADKQSQPSPEEAGGRNWWSGCLGWDPGQNRGIRTSEWCV